MKAQSRLNSACAPAQDDEASVLILPFVEDNTPCIRPSDRCFWHVSPTGDYDADCMTGAEYAEQAIAYAKAHQGGRNLINYVIQDMPTGKHTGVEVGFVSHIARLATQEG